MLGFLGRLAAEYLVADRGDRHHDRDIVLEAVDHLGHRIGQPDIGDDDDAGLAGGPRIAVGHGDHGTFLHALDELDVGLVDERVEDRRVAGRRVEEDVFDAGRLELRDEQRTAGAAHFAYRRAWNGSGCRSSNLR